jgi:hypothetical protein
MIGCTGYLMAGYRGGEEYATFRDLTGGDMEQTPIQRNIQDWNDQ